MTPIPSIPSILELIIEDSLESIFETLKKAVIAHRDGHTISVNFSNLRPRGDIISSVQKPSEGAVTFLKIFDGALSAINSKSPKQRQNIAILSVDHPDILEFLSYESCFSTKIGVTQKFITAVENDEMYDLIDPRSKKSTNKLNARSVYDLISDKTAANNESAVIYVENDPNIRSAKKIDSQTSLPFNESAQSALAEEIVPPPVVNMA